MSDTTLIPIDFMKWINENRHLLKPPVGNKVIWENGEFICMVVGGPNQRTDYHYDEGPEFFYQIEGAMTLKVMENGNPRDIEIGEGEILLLPPRVPHSPQRRANTVGLVIERKRRPDEQDGLLWYCEKCSFLLYEEYFELHNIESDFPAVFQRFYSDLSKRTCKNCHYLNPVPE